MSSPTSMGEGSKKRRNMSRRIDEKLAELERIQEIERQTYENIIDVMKKEMKFLGDRVDFDDETNKTLLKVELDGALEENDKLRAEIRRLKHEE